MNYGSISLQKSCINNFRGIFANAFSQLLLEEGILEAPIFCGSRIGFFNHELRFQYDKAGRFKYRSFWTPSFLEESIWLLAATRFRPHMELRSCIRCCLLPVLPDPDAIYRYVTSSKPLESQFIEFGILETPIRVIGYITLTIPASTGKASCPGNTHAERSLSGTQHSPPVPS